MPARLTLARTTVFPAQPLMAGTPASSFPRQYAQFRCKSTYDRLSLTLPSSATSTTRARSPAYSPTRRHCSSYWLECYFLGHGKALAIHQAWLRPPCLEIALNILTIILPSPQARPRAKHDHGFALFMTASHARHTTYTRFSSPRPTHQSSRSLMFVCDLLIDNRRRTGRNSASAWVGNAEFRVG